jgi:hypothetical protein
MGTSGALRNAKSYMMDIPIDKKTQKKSMTKRGEIVMVSFQWKALVVSMVFSSVLSLGVLNPGTGFAKQEKKDICHLEGNGSYHLITVAEPAWPTHEAHGDIDIITFYEDNDEDGFGTTASTVEACEQPEGYAAVVGDCDDTDAAVNPDATEITGNGIDDDCDPSTPDVVSSDCPCGVATEVLALWQDESVGDAIFDLCGVLPGIAAVIVHDGATGADPTLDLFAEVQGGNMVFTCTYVVRDANGDPVYESSMEDISQTGASACIQDISAVIQQLGGCP